MLPRMTDQAGRGAGPPEGRRPGQGHEVGRHPRRRRSREERATTHRPSSSAGRCLRAGPGHGHGPRAREETTDRAEGGDLARAEDSPCGSGGRIVLGRRWRDLGGGGGGGLDGGSHIHGGGCIRRHERVGRWGACVGGCRGGELDRHAGLDGCLWRFATWASSSRRRISRRTSGGGGESEPGGAGWSLSSSYSPLIHDISRLLGLALTARAPRTIASASIAVTPGTWLSPSPMSVAPHEGQVTSESDGNSAEHHMQ
jgi:hypothetical protein